MDSQSLKSLALDSIPFASSNDKFDALYGTFRKRIRNSRTFEETKTNVAAAGDDPALMSGGVMLYTTSTEGVNALMNRKNVFSSRNHVSEDDIGDMHQRLKKIAERFGLREIVVQGDQLEISDGKSPKDVIDAKLNSATRFLTNLAKELNVPESKIGLDNNLTIQIGNPKSFDTPATVATQSMHLVNPDKSSTIITPMDDFGHFAHEFGHAIDHISAVKAQDELDGGIRSIRKGLENFANSVSINGNDFLAAVKNGYHAAIDKGGDYASGGNDKTPTGHVAADAVRMMMSKASLSGYDLKARECDIKEGNSNPYFSDSSEKFARIFEAGVNGIAGRCSPTIERLAIKLEAKKAILDIDEGSPNRKKPAQM